MHITPPTLPRGKVRLSWSNSQVWNSNLNQDQAGLFYPKEAQVQWNFHVSQLQTSGQWCWAWDVVPSATEWYLEINIESCAWSGYHQESAVVAPHLQTAPPGLGSVPLTPQQSLGKGWPNRPTQIYEASSGATSSGHWQWSLCFWNNWNGLCNLKFSWRPQSFCSSSALSFCCFWCSRSIWTSEFSSVSAVSNSLGKISCEVSSSTSPAHGSLPLAAIAMGSPRGEPHTHAGSTSTPEALAHRKHSHTGNTCTPEALACWKRRSAGLGLIEQLLHARHWEYYEDKDLKVKSGNRWFLYRGINEIKLNEPFEHRGSPPSSSHLSFKLHTYIPSILNGIFLGHRKLSMLRWE